MHHTRGISIRLHTDMVLGVNDPGVTRHRLVTRYRSLEIIFLNLIL